MLAYLLLGVGQIVGLALIPLGAPGIWVQLAALGLFGWWSGFTEIGVAPLLILSLVALSSELIEPPLTRGRMESSVRRRLGITGMVGGLLGAALGFPLPLLGSMFGAYVGALVGSLAGVFGVRAPATGCAALGGYVLAMTIRTGTGAMIAAFSLLALLR